jgi:hypothetical protein
MDAVASLIENGDSSHDRPSLFEDFITFSIGRGAIGGRELLERGDVRTPIHPDILAHVRPDAELRAAELCYRLATALRRGAVLDMTARDRDLIRRALAPRPHIGPESERVAAEALADALRLRGDAFMATVMAHTPASGMLAERLDRRTGEPSSAQDLAWSHAAFVTAFHAREAALG